MSVHRQYYVYFFHNCHHVAQVWPKPISGRLAQIGRVMFSQLSECGRQHTTNHIIDRYAITQLYGRLPRLREVCRVFTKLTTTQSTGDKRTEASAREMK